MKHIPYFENLPDSSRMAVEKAKYEQLKIQPNDVLDIKIETLSSGTSESSSKPSAEGASQGILVDENGDVSLPIIGKIHLQGLTINEAKKILTEKADFYYKSATISVTFLNLKVSVIGEVNRPGIYILKTEQNTILDALANAGDLTIYGKRSNLVLIRDSSGFTTFTRFSLNSTDLVTKKFYYLKQNDIIYVEPNKVKVETLNSSTYAKVGILVSIVTMVALIYSQIIKN